MTGTKIKEKYFGNSKKLIVIIKKIKIDDKKNKKLFMKIFL